jgi:type IV pilus assembly protein PilE
MDFIIRAMVRAQSHTQRRRRIAGFTLIELMAVVVVIAILAVIALPAYRDYIRKSRRAEAIALISSIAQAQERWRANCSSYTSNVAAAPAAGCTGGLGIANPSSGYYTLSVTFPAASTSSYAATASAAGAQAGDAKCTSLTLAASGNNFTYNSTGTAASAVCWSR